MFSIIYKETALFPLSAFQKNGFYFFRKVGSMILYNKINICLHLKYEHWMKHDDKMRHMSLKKLHFYLKFQNLINIKQLFKVIVTNFLSK
jgi:hypothetical protein